MHGHSYSASVTPPTCTAQGYTTYTCECGDSYIDTYTSPLGHTPGAGAVCTSENVCTVCGETIPAADHTPGAAATCTTAQTCTVCGEILTPVLGHTPGAATTCTEAQTCTVCGEILTPALAHTPGAAAPCTTAQTCTVCGEILTPALAHSFSTEWTIDTPAMFETAGSKSHHCTNPECTVISNVTVIPKLLKGGTALTIIKLPGEGLGTLKCITGITAETSVANVLTKFEAGTIKLVNNGKELTADDLVGTGTVITLSDESGKVLDTLTVVVMGDVDGDAKISTDDARTVLRASVGLEALSGICAATADVVQSGEPITTDDARKILRASVGLDTITGSCSPVAPHVSDQEIFSFYKAACDKIKNEGIAGHTRKEWQDVTRDVDVGSSIANGIVKPIISSFMKGEDKAEESVSEKGSDAAKNRMCPANASIDMVESAACEEVNGNYIITIVMKTQKAMFGQPFKGIDGIPLMSTGILYPEDVRDTVQNNSTVSKVVKNIGTDSYIEYQNYTIVAEMTKDGQFISIDHSVLGDIYATAELVLIGGITGSGAITFRSCWYNFNY